MKAYEEFFQYLTDCINDKLPINNLTDANKLRRRKFENLGQRAIKQFFKEKMNQTAMVTFYRETDNSSGVLIAKATVQEVFIVLLIYPDMILISNYNQVHGKPKMHLGESTQFIDPEKLKQQILNYTDNVGKERKQRKSRKFEDADNN